MKIAIVGPGHPLRGGLSTFNHLLAQRLQGKGHEVVIYSFSLQYPSILFPGKTQFSDEEAPNDIEVRSVINSVNPFNWIRRGRQMKHAGFDQVIFRFWMPFFGPAFGTLARIIKGNRKTTISVIADNVIPHEKRPGDKLLASYFLSTCNQYLTMSKSVEGTLREWYPSGDINFHPHPMYESFGERLVRTEACRKLDLDPKNRYILFFGFIRKYKGLDLLLQSLKNLPDDVKLVVAGEFYTDSQSYHRIADDHGIRDRVIWHTRFIPDSEVRYFFSIADLVAQPYKSATQSGVTQIAYYYDVPMLVTNVGGLPELVSHNEVGLVCSPEPEAINQSLQRFFSEELFAPFSAAVKQRKSLFTWDAFIGKLIR
jgi:glycosyltransferase involved in cell wall biosynthesis